MKKKGRAASALRVLIAPVAMLAAVSLLITAVNHMESGRAVEGRNRLEDAVRRAAVTCYAGEGIYPPTLSYLEEHYGLQVDEARYTVHYSIFADNLMPDITVLENED